MIEKKKIKKNNKIRKWENVKMRKKNREER